MSKFSRFSKILLGAMTAVVPVAISCAYGMPYEYSRDGRVRDAATQAGIPGIEVTCLVGGAQEGPVVSSASDGTFVLEYDRSCDQVSAADVDGTANGTYEAKTIPFPDGPGTFEITLDPI